MWLRIVALLCIMGGAYQLFFADRALTHLPGEIAPHPPRQAPVEVAPFQHRDYRITPLASFAAEARVLSRENYRFGRAAQVAPVDLVLGWGPMSNQAVLDEVEISQGGRFYHWRVDQFPIPRRDIERHSANMHFIPADDRIHDRLADVQPGRVVHLRGYLVRVNADDGWHWNTSLTRDDTGDGACELVWLTSFEQL